MAVRGITPRHLDRTIAGVLLPSIQDVNNAIVRVVNTLFNVYCKKVDPAGDCIIAPVDPQLLSSKLMQDVTENAYIQTETPPTMPNLPKLNFTAKVKPPYTYLLVGNLKQNVALPIVGFVVASYANPFPVTAVNVYKGTGAIVLWKTAHIHASIPIDLPNLMPFDAPMKSYLALLSDPVIIPPGNMVMLEAVVNPVYARNPDIELYAWVMWLPPVVFVSRPAYIDAIAPQRGTQA